MKVVSSLKLLVLIGSGSKKVQFQFQTTIFHTEKNINRNGSSADEQYVLRLKH